MVFRSLSVATIAVASACATPAVAANYYVFSGSPTGSQTLLVNGAQTIHAFQTGWFNNSGSHFDAWSNYITGTTSDWLGTSETRSFFSFRPTGPITSASLTLGNALGGGYGNDTGGPLELTLYDVTSSIVGLLQYNGATSIFDDLGTGTVFGKITISAAASSYTIDLNAAGIKAFNDSYYGAGPLTIGARLTVAPSAVPEPAAWALLIGGFGVAGGALRRRRVTFARA